MNNKLEWLKMVPYEVQTYVVRQYKSAHDAQLKHWLKSGKPCKDFNIIMILVRDFYWESEQFSFLKEIITFEELLPITLDKLGRLHINAPVENHENQARIAKRVVKWGNKDLIES
ncbi:39636_t:CDS:2 [Gigaspora margarita]|uniref:39636_t:CDS:1 n=1 Tax=Gigaspora margarita TaxID=4874 RepID=A0ABN7UFU2_GIGMA|nr:39636_t:CDS:2 [Gigaspora margarita]